MKNCNRPNSGTVR